MVKIEFNEFLKDRNKVLMLIGLIICVILVIIVLINKNKSDGTDLSSFEYPKEFLLEPVAEEEKKPVNKLEAYKQDKEEEKRRKQEEEQSIVRGSDFYFDLQETDERYDERIERLQKDPYTEVTYEYHNNRQPGNNNAFASKMRQQLSDIEDEQTLEQIIKEAQKQERIRQELEKNESLQKEYYRKFIQGDTLPEEMNPTIFPEVENELAEGNGPEPLFIVENGKRRRRSAFNHQQETNLIKAAIYGDQVIVSGGTVKMRLLEPLRTKGMEIPANTIFYGTATVGANRLKITVQNLKYGNYISPVAFTIYDSDAIEGLNLPDNMKAEAARKMEQGLLQGVQLPISSIGTVTSEVTSAITATTQVTRQILNQSLSQVKVHLKANYNMFIKEETKEDKKKREEEEAEIERLYREMLLQQNDPVKKNPLQSLIDAL